jgi:cephalosporin-C deacetylase-like acetyl esterase
MTHLANAEEIDERTNEIRSDTRLRHRQAAMDAAVARRVGRHSASRGRADAIMNVGFIDTVCPASSCYAAYNSLLGEKQVINEPLMGHAAPPHIHEAFFKWVLQRIEHRTGQRGN